MSHYQLLKKSTQSAARRGVLSTAHGDIQTPNFMPVGTQGTVKTLHPDELVELDAQVILGNTYHLFLRPTTEVLESFGGLHNFMQWDRPILTDSGGFQVFSLAKIRKITPEGVWFNNHLNGERMLLSPETSLGIQATIGSDIAMIFDECPPYPCERSYAEKSTQLTTDWAVRCKNWIEANKPQAGSFGINTNKPTKNSNINETILDETGASRGTVEHSVDEATQAPRHFEVSDSLVKRAHLQLHFGIVQGSVYEDLREKSAKDLVNLNFDGYAIGGVSVGEPEAEMMHAVDNSIPFLPEDKVRYAMGLGTPPQLLEMISKGVDIFDCVMPTRLARHGVAFTVDGQINIKKQMYTHDQGPLCSEIQHPHTSRFSRAYIRHLFRASEPLAARIISFHNLNFYLTMMRNARHHIENDTFEAFRAEFTTRYKGGGN